MAREFTIGKTGSMTNARTESYAPNEQYERRGGFGPYTDVYALAATLYTLLTAEVPLAAHFRKYAQLPSAKQYNSKISDRVNDAIVKGMGLSPQERSQTVREFRELLGIATTENSPEPPEDTPPLPPDPKVDYAKLESLLKAHQG